MNTYTILQVTSWEPDDVWPWATDRIVEQAEFSDDVTDSELIDHARKLGLLNDAKFEPLAIHDDGAALVIVKERTYEPIVAFVYESMLIDNA